MGARLGARAGRFVNPLLRRGRKFIGEAAGTMRASRAIMALLAIAMAALAPSAAAADATVGSVEFLEKHCPEHTVPSSCREHFGAPQPSRREPSRAAPAHTHTCAPTYVQGAFGPGSARSTRRCYRRATARRRRSARSSRRARGRAPRASTPRARATQQAPMRSSSRCWLPSKPSRRTSATSRVVSSAAPMVSSRSWTLRRRRRPPRHRRARRARSRRRRRHKHRGQGVSQL